jgi:hypothetical protein
VKKPKATREQLNKIIEFRQEIHQNCLTKYRDAQFDLIESVLSNHRISSYAELTLSSQFKRQWHSGYQGIKAGRQVKQAVAKLLHKQLPSIGIRVYALDTTIWPHPRARTLNGLVYEYNATLSKGQTVISKAHVYSGLCWIPERRGSWALPLSMRRLPVKSTAVTMGVAQVKQFLRERGAVSDDVLDIIASDGHYGTHLYLAAFKGVKQLGAITRLRRDRVLSGPPPPYSGRGRPPVHGHRFAFAEPETWWEPDEQVLFEDAYHGRVVLQAWHHLHAKQDASTSFSVIRARIHQERTAKKRPKAIWLAYIGPELDMRKAWECFDHRWAIEPQFRFRKQQLHWTLPMFQLAQRCDRWSQLIDLAYWQLYLARDIVADQPRPWQASLDLLTPGRVLQGFSQLFTQLNSPTPLPQRRGKSPGWVKGTQRTKRPKRKPLKRNRKRRKVT